MPCSPEQLAANRRNSEKSSGPKTQEGKEASRRNGFKHGLTGAGIVQSPADAAATKDLAARFLARYQPETELGEILINRMAVHAVRLDRCGADELAQVELGEETPGYDASLDAKLAWTYEQAAERGLFRALREFRQVEGRGQNLIDAKPTTKGHSAELASSLNFEKMAASLDILEKTQDVLEQQLFASQPKVTPVPNPKVEPSIIDLLGRGPGMPKLPSKCVNFTIGKKR